MRSIARCSSSFSTSTPRSADQRVAQHLDRCAVAEQHRVAIDQRAELFLVLKERLAALMRLDRRGALPSLVQPERVRIVEGSMHREREVAVFSFFDATRVRE